MSYPAGIKNARRVLHSTQRRRFGGARPPRLSNVRTVNDGNTFLRTTDCWRSLDTPYIEILQQYRQFSGGRL